jgi:small subunit ribosomal protein S16
MPVKIRLSRQGKKNYPFYHIIAADSRAPRDGKFIERLGSFDPNTNPATIILNFDRAIYWLQSGAQPTDTARTILSREGVLMKNHLLGGVKKGALTAEQAEEKFATWKTSKEAQIVAAKANLVKSKADQKKAKLEAETKVKEARAEAIAKAKQAAVEAAASKSEETEAAAE